MIAYKERPSGLYTPSVFARVGLCLLTSVIVLAVLGLAFLVVASGSTSSAGYGILCLFVGLVCYAVLEVFVQLKGHFRSGVDDALLFASVTLVCVGIAVAQNTEPGTLTWVAYGLICGYAVLRFGDRLMTLCALGCFLAAIFFSTLGHTADYLGIGLLAALSLSLDLLALRMDKEAFAKPYRGCLLVLRYASLLTLYASVNYYFVLEVYTYDIAVAPSAATGVFWITTDALPILYIIIGLRGRSRPALHVGMVTAAATIFTYRHYHPLLPLAEAMTLAGLLLIGAAWGLIHYLKEPKGGITSEALGAGATGLELLAVTQAFGARGVVPPAHDGTSFGGGSFGGGGAGGDF